MQADADARLRRAERAQPGCTGGSHQRWPLLTDPGPAAGARTPGARSHRRCTALRWGGSSALLTAAPYPAAALSPQRLSESFTSPRVKLRPLKLVTSVLAANQADPVLPSHAHNRNPSLLSSVRAENDWNCVLGGNYHEIALGHRLGACHMFHYLLKDSCSVLGNIYKAKLFTGLCLFLASMQPERR